MSRLAPANRRPTTSLRPPLRKGKIGRQDVLFEEKNHIFFQNIIIFGFLQGNPTESILWGVQHHWNLPKTSRHEMFLPGAPPHGGRSAGRAARIAPWCPSSWMLRWDMWYLGVPETGGISQNCCFLREIWWLYEWPLDFGVSCFQTKPICLSAFRHVFPCP